MGWYKVSPLISKHKELNRVAKENKTKVNKVLGSVKKKYVKWIEARTFSELGDIIGTDKIKQLLNVGVDVWKAAYKKECKNNCEQPKELDELQEGIVFERHFKAIDSNNLSSSIKSENGKFFGNISFITFNPIVKDQTYSGEKSEHSLTSKSCFNTKKNYANDALAICEAAFRPGIHFVPVKSFEQQDIKALRCVRTRLVQNRTGTVNQIRSLAAEYGVTFPLGRGSYMVNYKVF